MRVRLSIAAVLLLALASAVPAASFSFKLDSDHSAKVTAESSSGDASERSFQNPPSAQPGTVIDRIIFIGNRRIRSDTLKARIFTREGDNYNEETLRRAFQALWNTQFFEDVKLRVEDSPNRSSGKIIIFDVKEHPQIRRIPYAGVHSVSESDILDRFKHAKVGLSVE